MLRGRPAPEPDRLEPVVVPPVRRLSLSQEGLGWGPWHEQVSQQGPRGGFCLAVRSWSHRTAPNKSPPTVPPVRSPGSAHPAWGATAALPRLARPQTHQRLASPAWGALLCFYRPGHLPVCLFLRGCHCLTPSLSHRPHRLASSTRGWGSHRGHLSAASPHYHLHSGHHSTTSLSRPRHGPAAPSQPSGHKHRCLLYTSPSPRD